MIERLEQQTKLTSNQWKLIITGNLADLLDFLDFFLIGAVGAYLIKEWQLTYWQGAAIFTASGFGAVPGAFFWGWVADKIGRRKVFISTAINVALATGAMYFTPDANGWIAGWVFLSVMRFFVGVGNAGLYAVDLPLVQEFIPGYKRGWVSALVTTLLPAGVLLGALAGWLLPPYIGWRGVFLVGLAPIVLVLMVRYWVPESPRWLIRMGRHEEARRSLAWALMVDPEDIALPATLPEAEKARWSELFKYPRSVAAGCLTGLTQTGGVGLGLWGTSLLVLVLHVDLGERVGDPRPLLHHRPDRAAGAPRLGYLVLCVGGGVDGARRLSAQCLHRLRVAVLCADSGADVLRQRQLFGRRAVYGRDLADPAARQRHGTGVWGRQQRQDPGTARIGGDPRCQRSDQAGSAESRSARAGLPLFRVVVGPRNHWVLVHRLRDQGPHVRGDGQRARRAGAVAISCQGRGELAAPAKYPAANGRASRPAVLIRNLLDGGT